MHLVVVYTSSSRHPRRTCMNAISPCAMSLIITINLCASTPVCKLFRLQIATVILHSTYAGHSKPAMYTELHPDGSLSLFFNSLQEEQAGKYTCKGNYARNVPLNKSVIIETISEYRIESPVAFSFLSGIILE